MANMCNINSLSYKAHENPEWFTRAAFGSRLVTGGYVRVLTGVKGDELLSMIDLENKVLQADGKDCAWTPNQIVKLSEKKASVKTYKINLEQCIDELENKRTMYLLSPGAKNESLPDELESATLALIAIGLSNEVEEHIIGGDESKDAGQFDGMEKILLRSTQAAKLVGGVIAKENVIKFFESVYDAFTEEVLQAEDSGSLYAFASYGTRRKLRSAIAKQIKNDSLAEEWAVTATDPQNPQIFFNGMEVVAVKGIGANTIIGFAANNALLLTDMESDLDQIELGSFPKPNEDKVWVKGRMRLGFVMPFEDEAVILSDKITTEQKANYGKDSLQVSPSSLVFKASGETLTFNVVAEKGVVPTVSAAPTGFTVTKETPTTVDGKDVTAFKVVATSNVGAMSPRVGQLIVGLPDEDRSVTVTLNQRNEDSDDVVTE